MIGTLFLVLVIVSLITFLAGALKTGLVVIGLAFGMFIGGVIQWKVENP